MTNSRIIQLSGLLLLAAGCTEPVDEESHGSQLLSPRQQLKRVSVDLRGVHPSEAEMQAIENNPALYEEYVDRYLQDPRMLERMREIFNYRYLLRTGATYDMGADNFSSTEVSLAIDNEALRLLTRIIEFDLPYSEIVLADYTMANPALAEAFDLDYPEGATNWQPAWYTDDRPHAGILTMSSTWLRYPSMAGNANRHRANALSKMLLCDDYLARPVVLSRAAVDQLTVDPEAAINENDACQSCHSTLDPLSAHFFGFFKEDEDDYSVDYQPEREEVWRDYSGKAPAYYGIPTANFDELVGHIADDSRFVDCAVQTVFEGLTQRLFVDADWSEFQTHRDAFEDGDLVMRPLIKSIVMSDNYRAEFFDDAELAERVPTIKTVSPGQFADIIEDATGYRWTFGGSDGMTAHTKGLPVLAGGIDGAFVTERAYEPSVGLVFIQERLATSAAWFVAEHDLDPDRTEPAILLKYVTINDDPDGQYEAFKQQLEELYLEVAGVPLEAGDLEADALITLWRQLYSVEASPTKAWAGVLSAILRDPAVLFY